MISQCTVCSTLIYTECTLVSTVNDEHVLIADSHRISISCCQYGDERRRCRYAQQKVCDCPVGVAKSRQVPRPGTQGSWFHSHFAASGLEECV